MKSRCPLHASAVALIFIAAAASGAQVDQHWLGMWTEAQHQRPAALSDTGRIAPADEPGTSLVIHGLVVDPDGAAPVANAIVFAYHTDGTGVYFRPGENDRPWRLKGWTRTDANGRFEFATIRPAPYPNRRTPAHVHLTVETPRYGRQYAGLLFADDPLVSLDERTKSDAAGRFGQVLRVQQEGPAQQVRLTIRLKARGDF